MNEQELDLLKRLESDGLLSAGTTSKIRLAADIADVAGKRTTRFLSSVASALLACALMSIGAWSPFHWLSVLSFSTMIVSFLTAAFFFVCGVEKI